MEYYKCHPNKTKGASQNLTAAPKKAFAPQIDRKLCKRCGLCAHFCPRQVLAVGEDGYPRAARPEKCQGCGLCFDHCPDFALEVREVDEPR
ncbi:MAG: 4Fe-4S binding protein [Peptococcaceae bacterium]|nr:4Fe-4S binding protein [Peptococcaceae bacterium]